MTRQIDVADLDPANPKFTVGSPEDRKKAVAQWRRDTFAAQVFRSTLEEIPASRLVPFWAGLVEDSTSGAFYRPRVDGLRDFNFAGNAVAYFCDDDGYPVLLERPSGFARNRAELEERRADRERRRNAPKAARR